MRDLATAAALLLLCGTSGCVGAVEGGDEEEDLEAGREIQSYYSDVASEYEVAGSVPLTMTPAEHADPATRQQIASRRIAAVGLYLTTYLTNKFYGIDVNGDGVISEDEVFFHNEEYGGFSAMVRNSSASKITISATGGGYSASFTLAIAGPRDLFSRVPLAGGDASCPAVFDLNLPEGATVDPQHVDRHEIRSFDPATFAGEVETLRLTARRLPQGRNAYPGYADFVADGVYDLTLFFGHDYNPERSDLQEARAAFEHLVARGFKAPVPGFDALRASSGPLTRSARASGKSLSLRVRIFHSDMFVGQRKQQHDLALSEIATRDVFFYNGHAGPYFGFYLDAAGEATVAPAEFATAPFRSRQQLVVAQGCQTYSQYADMLYASPVKSEANLDVITTVNFSYGQGTLGLLDQLTRLDGAANHRPADFYQLIGVLNADLTNSAGEVLYGVTGIDGNGRLHPYSRPSAIGRACKAASECGDVTGNVCVKIGAQRRCGARALDAKACPAGSTYKVLSASGAAQGGACLP